MNIISLSLAFLMGFTGSLHCAGMCGPIVWIMPFQAHQGIKKFFAFGLYHLGRISVYASLAIILHSFRAFFNPTVQQYISIGLGSLLLAAGIVSFLPNKWAKINLPWAGYVTQQLGAIVGRPGLSTLAIAGILNGMLPCGLVYMALSASISTTSGLQAALFMLAFGLGTLPLLVAISLLRQRIMVNHTHLKKIAPAIVFCFGCLFILRGLNLNIPYLSPKVEVTQHEIKSCCSHKKCQ